MGVSTTGAGWTLDRSADPMDVYKGTSLIVVL